MGGLIRSNTHTHTHTHTHKPHTHTHMHTYIYTCTYSYVEQGAGALTKVLDLEPKNTEARASLQMAQMKAARARQAS
jgi:hypothetical protein